MKVRIGVVDSEKVVELEIDDHTAFRKMIEAAFAGGHSLVWVTDDKGRDVAIPRDKVSFVEIEGVLEKQRVGFAPAAS